MRLREVFVRVDEMPVSVNLIGQQEPGSFRDDDIRLATAAKARAKAEKIWHSSVADVILYLVNVPADDVVRDDLLSQSDNWAGRLTSNHRARIVKQTGVNIQATKGAITVVLTQNEGGDRLPLTGWMIAHRMGHLFFDAERSGRMTGQLGGVVSGSLRELEIDRMQLQDLVDKLYQIPEEMRRRYVSVTLAFFHAIGTTRAARTGNLASHGEILIESFAQFMLTGQVRFNPAPPALEASYYHDIYTATISDRDRATLDHAVEQFATSLMDTFGQVIDYAKGRVFIL